MSRHFPILRRPLSLVVGLLAVLAGSASSALYAQEKPADILARKLIISRDVEYAKIGERSLKLDVVQPREPAEEKLPAVVFVHGGAWRFGDKSHSVGAISALALTNNYVGFTIQYRLTDAAAWPAQIHDCKAAIRWIRAHADEYHVDPERIGVWGGSAGGHLVSMLGTSGNVKECEGELGNLEASSCVKCVVDFCGPSDFVQFPLSDRAKQAVEPLLGGRFDDKQDVARSASPVTYITPDDPPFLIVHGSEDPIVPLAQAETLHAQLSKAGVDSTFVLVRGGGHNVGGPEVARRVLAFFDKHLRGQDVEISGDPIELEKPTEKK